MHSTSTTIKVAHYPFLVPRNALWPLERQAGGGRSVTLAKAIAFRTAFRTKENFMPEYQLYCFAQSGNAYRAALMLNLG